MKRILLFVVLSAVLLSLWGCNEKQAARPFITKWKGTAGQEIKIPILGTYTLTWYNEATPEDRHTEQVSITSYMGKYESEETSPYIFTPPSDGIYVVEAGPEGVEGMLMSFGFDDVLHAAPRLLSVVQFGDVVWKQLHKAFLFCSNMQFAEGIDTPNLSQCTNLKEMFWLCKAFNTPLEQWDVSKITNMDGMFYGCESFNQPLESWDVSQVTNMSRMFANCSTFNQPLEKWNVSNVTDMSGMFDECHSFNQPLEKWNVSKVTSMTNMFSSCTVFNQPLAQWDVANVKSMFVMFAGCTSFNQSLEAWKINPLAQTEGMAGMFSGSPAAALPFVVKWREAGYQLDEIIEGEEYLENELEQQ